MNWNSWHEFLAMGGYGFYVWGAYVVTFVLLIVELAEIRSRKALAEQAMREPRFDASRGFNEA